jgi:uncharacterized lipoprotein YddW (UPF0748 family)
MNQDLATTPRAPRRTRTPKPVRRSVVINAPQSTDWRRQALAAFVRTMASSVRGQSPTAVATAGPTVSRTLLESLSPRVRQIQRLARRLPSTLRRW